MNLSRRTFLAGASAAAVTDPLFSIAETPRFEIALSQYSLRALLKDGSLDALDFPAFTADKFGIKAIDLWEGGLPSDKIDDETYLTTIRSRAEKAGTDLFLLMSGALNADPKKSNFDQISASIPRAKTLGCDYVRVFLRAPGEDAETGTKACVEALKPLSDKAADAGVMIVIEPGASKLSQQGAFLADVMTQLKHPACRLMPDFGKLKNNVYDGTAAMLPHTETISCKMHSFNEEGNQPDFDYPRLIKMIAESDYKGYLSIEWEGHKLEPVPGVLASKKLIEKSIAML